MASGLSRPCHSSHSLTSLPPSPLSLTPPSIGTCEGGGEDSNSSYRLKLSHPNIGGSNPNVGLKPPKLTRVRSYGSLSIHKTIFRTASSFSLKVIFFFC